MNILSIPRLKKALLYIGLLLTPLWGSTQVEQIKILANQTFSYNFNSVPFSASIFTEPQFGNAYFLNANNEEVLNGGIGNVTMFYEPDSAFTGRDIIELSYGAQSPIPGVPGNLKYKQIELNVLALIANDDYVNTLTNTSININLLGNDILGDFPNAHITDILLSNNGNVYITSDSTVTFEPKSNFTGVAKFTYRVCNDLGCDFANVRVIIPNSENMAYNLQTIRDTPLDVYLYLEDGFSVTTQPQHGAVEIINTSLARYTPNVNFYGDDNFTFYTTADENEIFTTFNITVLNKKPNTNEFAFDDKVFIKANRPDQETESIEIDVMSNDIGLLTLQSNLSKNPEYGVVEKEGDLLIYTPEPNFIGIDKFKYKVRTASSFYEIAEVTVIVSEYQPSEESFDLYTPVGVPLVIDYQAPIDGFEFLVTAPAETGDVKVYQGLLDTIINGQQINGKDIIIYTPTCEEACLDAFELDYCINGSCVTVKVDVHVVELDTENELFCISECVWSGDANYDGKVDMSDILPMGYCLGEDGTIRDDATKNWHGQGAEDWSNQFINSSMDLKHIDTDGNGTVSALDSSSLLFNYGLYHTITPSTNLLLADLPLYFIPTTTNPSPGEMMTYDIILGTPFQPLDDISGLTLYFNYDTNIVNDSLPINVKFNSDSWLIYNSPFLSLNKKSSPGKMEAGVSRTISVASNGFGLIGSADFIIVDDIDGNRPGASIPLIVTVGGTYMDSQGNIEQFPLTQVETQIVIPQGYSKLDESQLQVSPNPTDGYMKVYLNGKNKIENYSIYSMLGQEVYRSKEMETKGIELDLNDLHNGMYILNVMTSKGAIAKKIQVFR